MIDIHRVIEKAIEKACETEQLPDFNRKDAASLEKLRKRNYPTNRSMKEYFNELPLLQSLMSESIHLLDIGAGNGLAIKEMVAKHNCSAKGTGIKPITKKAQDFL